MYRGGKVKIQFRKWYIYSVDLDLVDNSQKTFTLLHARVLWTFLSSRLPKPNVNPDSQRKIATDQDLHKHGTLVVIKLESHCLTKEDIFLVLFSCHTLQRTIHIPSCIVSKRLLPNKQWKLSHSFFIFYAPLTTCRPDSLPWKLLFRRFPLTSGTMSSLSLDDLILELYNVEGLKFGSFTVRTGEVTPVYIDMRVIWSYPHLVVSFPCSLLSPRFCGGAFCSCKIDMPLNRDKLSDIDTRKTQRHKPELAALGIGRSKPFAPFSFVNLCFND